MFRIRWIAAVAVTGAAAAGMAAVPQTAGAADADATLRASHYRVLQNDATVLSGRTRGAKALYRSLDGKHYHRIGTVHPHGGRYSASVHPVAGRVNRYRVGTSSHVSVTSIACAPLPSTAGPQAWFNVRYSGHSAMASKLAGLVCSAAPHSSIDISMMNIFGGTASVDLLIANLRNVATYRGVQVDVLVKSGRYHSYAVHHEWTWNQFRSAFKFAHVHSCTAGCSLHGPGTAMHSKFMTVSALKTGGSAVVGMTINWSPQQFDSQNGSAVYVHNDARLYSAFVAAHERGVDQVPLSSGRYPVGWHPTERGVSYAFDPSTVDVDPVANELTALACHPGDWIGLMNANVTRARIVVQLNRLQAAGCMVRVITEQAWRSGSERYPIRRMMMHDRTAVIHAHWGDGSPVSEVISTAELFRPASLTLTDEQLIRIRNSQIYDDFRWWFWTKWKEAA